MKIWGIYGVYMGYMWGIYGVYMGYLSCNVSCKGLCLDCILSVVLPALRNISHRLWLIIIYLQFHGGKSSLKTMRFYLMLKCVKNNALMGYRRPTFTWQGL